MGHRDGSDTPLQPARATQGGFCQVSPEIKPGFPLDGRHAEAPIHYFVRQVTLFGPFGQDMRKPHRCDTLASFLGHGKLPRYSIWWQDSRDHFR